MVRSVTHPNRAVAMAMLATMLCFAVTAEAEDAEPSLEECTTAMSRAHERLVHLPPKSLSRYFAERYLQSAYAEAGNGEFDECLEYSAKAVEEIETRSHWLAPGETFRATTSTGYVELSGDDQ